MEVKILTPQQIAVLKKISGNKYLSRYFYLSGGTALSGFYLGHRYSEDLDFFSETEVDLPAINVFMRRLKKELKIHKVDLQQSNNRNLFFLHFGKEILKTEFTYFPFPRINKSKKMFGLAIDSLLDIAVNKFFSIYQRTIARDYIDLYCICQKENFDMHKLFRLTRAKFDYHIDPLQLGTQFAKAKEVKDYPRMIAKISNPAWQNFFLQEAKKLKSKILA